MKEVGAYLWDAIFPESIQAFFDRTCARADQTGDHIIIRLSVVPTLESLPWEALYDRRRLGFIAIDKRYSLADHTWPATETALTS